MDKEPLGAVLSKDSQLLWSPATRDPGGVGPPSTQPLGVQALWEMVGVSQGTAGGPPGPGVPPASCSPVGAGRGWRRGPSQVTTRLYWRRGHTHNAQRSRRGLAPPPPKRACGGSASPPAHPRPAGLTPARPRRPRPQTPPEAKLSPGFVRACPLPGALRGWDWLLPASRCSTEALGRPRPLRPSPRVLSAGTSVSAVSRQHVALRQRRTECLGLALVPGPSQQVGAHSRPPLLAPQGQRAVPGDPRRPGRVSGGAGGGTRRRWVLATELPPQGKHKAYLQVATEAATLEGRPPDRRGHGGLGGPGLSVLWISGGSGGQPSGWTQSHVRVWEARPEAPADSPEPACARGEELGGAGVGGSR